MIKLRHFISGSSRYLRAGTFGVTNREHLNENKNETSNKTNGNLGTSYIIFIINNDNNKYTLIFSKPTHNFTVYILGHTKQTKTWHLNSVQRLA